MALVRDQAPEGHILLRGISWPTCTALLKDLEPYPGSGSHTIGGLWRSGLLPDSMRHCRSSYRKCSK